MKNEVILIIPLCNPKIENFNKFITEIEKYFNKILIINDGSNKKYNDFFDNLTIKYAVLTNEVPLGKGACIKSGINYILIVFLKSYRKISQSVAWETTK